MSKGALQNIRITEFTSAWAGPYASAVLSFLGAEVIKVESRKRVDHSRRLSFSTGMVSKGYNESDVFNGMNFNKKSVTLNLSKPKAVEIAKRLIAHSDATLENMRPGVMQRLGLGYEVLKAVKPDIIYLSSSAAGQTGPEREYVGYAPTFAAVGGISFITGYGDWPPSNFMGSIDLRSAVMSAFAILAALYHRQKTGEGQYIDLASQEAIAMMTGDAILDYSMNGRVQMRQGNRDLTMAPHNCYRCKGEDRWISIAVDTDEEWQALCNVMEKPDLSRDSRFADGSGRWTHQEELDRIIGQWTIRHEDYALMERLQKAGVAATPSLNSKDLFNDPHIKNRGIFTQMDHPHIGKTWGLTPPWRFSETPAEIRRHAPDLGEHNDEIFHGLLGMSRDEIKALEAEEVIY